MTSEDQAPTFILQRMVLEVFGERDAVRRAAAVQELFASDATFSDAEASVTGHEAIDATAGRILAGAPSDARWRPLVERGVAMLGPPPASSAKP